MYVLINYWKSIKQCLPAENCYYDLFTYYYYHFYEDKSFEKIFGRKTSITCFNTSWHKITVFEIFECLLWDQQLLRLHIFFFCIIKTTISNDTEYSRINKGSKRGVELSDFVAKSYDRIASLCEHKPPPPSYTVNSTTALMKLRTCYPPYYSQHERFNTGHSKVLTRLIWLHLQNVLHDENHILYELSTEV